MVEEPTVFRDINASGDFPISTQFKASSNSRRSKHRSSPYSISSKFPKEPELNKDETTAEPCFYFPANGINITDLKDCSTNSNPITSIGTTKSILNDIKVEQANLVHINGIGVALFRHKNEVFAVDNKCPHMGGPLHLGDIEDFPDQGLCVSCPWHGWRYSLSSGRAVHPPKCKLKVQVYPVKVDYKGDIFIGFDTFDHSYLVGENF